MHINKHILYTYLHIYIDKHMSIHFHLFVDSFFLYYVVRSGGDFKISCLAFYSTSVHCLWYACNIYIYTHTYIYIYMYSNYMLIKDMYDIQLIYMYVHDYISGTIYGMCVSVCILHLGMGKALDNL